MKTTLRFCLWIALAAATLGQTPEAAPAPTRIGSHRLGESLSEWLGVQKIDLTLICQNHDKTGPSLTANVSDWVKCDSLSRIRDTGKGYSWATSEDFKWVFVDGKLSTVTRVYPLEDSAQQAGFLKDAYGPASKTEVVPVQNAYGAKWNETVAAWNMPDGAVITLTALGGPSASLIVLFQSKEAVKAQAPYSDKPNPYTSKP